MPIKKRHISAADALGDVQPNEAPPGIPQRQWNRTRPEGQRENKEIAWYRGQQAGWFDAIIALQEMGDPGSKIAARRLQEHYSLDDDGAIVLWDGSAETDKE